MIYIKNANQVVTISSASRAPLIGKAMGDLNVIEHGGIVLDGDQIVFVGTDADAQKYVDSSKKEVQIINAAGKVVTPGFVDPHTHLVFAGSREKELEMRLKGASYMEILQAGGGILSTSSQTQQASLDQLVQESQKRLDRFLLHGVTTIEAKSGYGLTLEDELKQLRAAKRLNEEHPVDIVSTFMGAHAVPVSYKDNPEEYVRIVIEEMIPNVAQEGLAEFCDVFCEKGVFSIAQSERILNAGKQYGLKPKIHADEIVSFGGAELAAKVGAVSADHLLKASRDGIHQMANAGVIAVLLPGTAFFLMEEPANARRMIEAGVAVALSTDRNPGSSPTESLSLIMNLACLNMRMTPAEVLAACTINAAHAICRADRIGSLEPGKLADVVILDAPNYAYLQYNFGVNLVDTVIKRGKIVVESGHLCRNTNYQFIDPPQIRTWIKPGPRDEMKMNQLIQEHRPDRYVDVGILGVPLSRTSISVSGASEFPNALRLAWKYFSTYNLDFGIDLNSLTISDFGDVRMHWTDIPLCHRNIEEAVLELLSKQSDFLPIFVGGDHSITCPIVKALKQFFTQEKIGIVQLDTHFDLRDLRAGGAVNGTPIRGLIESGTIKGEHVINIGPHGYYNTLSLKKYADLERVKYVTLREVRRAGIQKIIDEGLQYLQERVDRIYVTVDMDVLDMSFAPGVPASTPNGLYSWELFEMLYLLGQEPMVCGMDVVELDPNRDPQPLITVKTGAHAILNFLCGYSRRKDKMG